MGWKFSSSCHIDSSFSERNLPIMHTSSKKGPRMIIVGPQYTDPRSAVRSTEVFPAASGLSRGSNNCLIHAASLIWVHEDRVRGAATAEMCRAMQRSYMVFQ